MKLITKSIAASLVALAVSSSAALAGSYMLNVSTSQSTDNPVYFGLEAFKKNVEERTKGDIKVRIFANSQLGNDEDILEQARAGANTAVVVDGGRLAEFAPELAILSAPFLITSVEDMNKVVTSDLFNGWSDKLAGASGHRILGFNWYQGERHFLTKKPIKTPADLAGVRTRTIGAPIFMESVRLMGATPTPMGWPEVYPALQQGVIDGAEAQSPSIHDSSLFEVATHYTKTGHFFLITGLVTGDAWFNTLPAEYKTVVREEALRAGDVATQVTLELQEKAMKQLAEKGLIIDEVDTAIFKEATEPVFAQLGLEDLRKQVNDVLAK
ncbi:C4-dicarboxylate ABC transporter [Rhodobacteraceae bacterium RKSG542]|uniref:C4-dicarboxylate TRAP transporter substrate-binding protein n=1 Tax=Pseudovibrio flavus TaxID=2529854 RepID=UPI0012BD55EA|nr:C4-dicarboxylate TRAP transporter substrate-binding protein [Pseudovibrio flavus]MTI18192.1 C4-dicarboxylate ABC transporter [Pseudovibrio flavus]